MDITVPKKINLQKFAGWIKKFTKCELRITAGNRLNIVVFADNIESGRCVALFAESDGETVQISELAGDYYFPEEAWQALEKGADSFPPAPFHQWVKDQYLTAENVQVEKFVF